MRDCVMTHDGKIVTDFWTEQMFALCPVSYELFV